MAYVDPRNPIILPPSGTAPSTTPPPGSSQTLGTLWQAPKTGAPQPQSLQQVQPAPQTAMPWAPGGTAPSTTPPPPSASTVAPPPRNNFSWIENGVSYNTNNWTPAQWEAYEKRQGLASPQTAAPAAPGSNLPTTAGGALTGNAVVGGQINQGAQTNVAGAFQQALLNKLNPAAVNAQNPEIQGAIRTNRLAEQRGMERERAMLAERAAAQGMDASGGFESQLLGLAQNRAAREAGFEGQQVADLGRRQSQEVMAALGLGGQMLSDQDRMNLQRYGIDTDAALRREGYGMQGSLGNRELDIRDKLGSGNLNMGLLGLLLNNQQFGQNLGAQLGMFNANQDQNWWQQFI